jgi:hypothetical protein
MCEAQGLEGVIMPFSLISTLIDAARSRVEAPLADVGGAFVAQAMLQQTGREAVIALGTTLALFLILLMAPVLPSNEWAIILAGIVMMLFLGHLAKDLWVLVGWVTLWWRLRIGPRRLLRVILFRIIMRGQEELEQGVQLLIQSGSLPLRMAHSVAAGLYATEQPDQVAWRLAESTEASILRHALRTLALALLPILSVFWAFRWVVVYGGLLGRTAHMGPLEAAVYPLAALIDLLFGTSLRTLLQSG